MNGRLSKLYQLEKGLLGVKKKALRVAKFKGMFPCRELELRWRREREGRWLRRRGGISPDK